METEPPIEAPPARSRLTLPRWVWIALGVVVVFSSVVAFQARRTSLRLRELESQLAAERDRGAALRFEQQRSLLLTAIVSSPATRQYSLFPTAGDTPALRVYWNEKLGFVLSAPGAAPANPGRTYQFWIMPKEGLPISVGVFSPAAAGGEVHVFSVTQEFSKVAGLIVTDEPAGGSPQPTPPALWQADFKREPIIQEPDVEPPDLEGDIL